MYQKGAVSRVELKTLSDPVKYRQYIGSRVSIILSDQYLLVHVKMGLLTFKDHLSQNRTDRVNRVSWGYSDGIFAGLLSYALPYFGKLI